ncbi:hypothetical protein N2M06_13470 [Oceanimonas sp. AH20CE76]
MNTINEDKQKLIDRADLLLGIILMLPLPNRDMEHLLEQAKELYHKALLY